MHHYVYRIERPATGEFYIGLRSSKKLPQDDTSYMGSGVRVRRIPRTELMKTILVVVESRDEAARIEAGLVTVKTLLDPRCLNLTTGGSLVSSRYPSEKTRAKLRAAWPESRRTEQRLTNRIRQRKLEEGRRLKRLYASRRQPQDAVVSKELGR